MLFKSYPHTNHKAMKFVKLRVSMWIIRRKNFFNFSLLPVARLNCYNVEKICGMEMWITGYGAMENAIHSTWKSQSTAFPRPANGVSHNPIRQPVTHIPTNPNFWILPQCLRRRNPAHHL
jgi:hypothetical protein